MLLVRVDQQWSNVMGAATCGALVAPEGIWLPHVDWKLLLTVTVVRPASGSKPHCCHVSRSVAIRRNQYRLSVS